MDLGKINGIQEAVLDTVKMMFNEYTKNLNYDQTAVYTIYDDSEKDKGRYLVGETKDAVFTACSPNQQYKKGDKVYVTIPQGDNSKTKFIVSTYLDPATGLSLGYRAPHNAIAPVKELSSASIFDLPIINNGCLKKQFYLIGKDEEIYNRVENDFTRLYFGVGFNNFFANNDNKTSYQIRICIITSTTFL